MSLKGETKKSQKYHNKTAYEVRFNQRKLDINARAPLDRLCARCMEQVQWKIQYGKYKPKTSLSRCNKCTDKSIAKAYRTVCDKCADKDRVCSKCGQSKEIVDAPKQEKKLDRNGVDRDKLKKMEDYLEELRERSRRTIMRKLMKGEVEFVDGYFVTVEDGKPITNLRFKGDVDEMDDNWGDDDDEDDDFGDDDDDLDDDDDDEEDVKEERKQAAKKDKNGKNKESAKEKEEEIKEVKEIKAEEANKKVTFKEPPKGKKEDNKKKPQKKKQESSDDDDDDDDDDFDDDF